MPGQPTVACVLRGGGVYDSDWAVRLGRQIARHAPGTRFVCLSDTPHALGMLGVDAVQLRHDWPGWWSKVELFRPGLFDGPVLFLDLDTLVLGPLDDLLAYRGPLATLRDFYRPRGLQSAVMAWTPGPVSDAIYARFLDDVAGITATHGRGGDQAWIEQVFHQPAPDGHAGDWNRYPGVDRLQDIAPGRIVSFKADLKAKRCADSPPPSTVSLVCFHGKPKNDDFPPDHWVTKAWVGA